MSIFENEVDLDTSTEECAVCGEHYDAPSPFFLPLKDGDGITRMSFQLGTDTQQSIQMCWQCIATALPAILVSCLLRARKPKMKLSPEQLLEMTIDLLEASDRIGRVAWKSVDALLAKRADDSEQH